MSTVRVATYQVGVHVKDDDLLPEVPGCPICSSMEARPRVLRLQSNPDVYLLRCGHCNGNSASRMPTGETLRRYYSNYYEHSDSAVTSNDPTGFARHIVDRVAPYLKNPSVSILDFGGGGGDLATEIAKLLLSNGSTHVEIDLVDYNSNLNRTTTGGVIVNAHQVLDEVKKNNFDLVLASAILEHLPSPFPTLVDLLSRLTLGGVFYARTPSMAQILGIFEFLGLTFDFTFPGHVHDLGQAFWEKVPKLVEPQIGTLKIITSRPSVVETSFSSNPFRTLAAYALKAPWYLLGSSYRLVGGWEVVFQRTTAR